jgi:chromosome segregation ATPase
VHRLADLQESLRAQVGQLDFSGVAAELARLGQALPQLDFGLLQKHGWWARTMGKKRGASDEFVAQFERIEDVAQALAAQNQLLRQSQQRLATADRTLLEVEVELGAIENIIDQGTRWLQDMRNQLKARQAAPADEAARRQIDEDAGRCEMLVARLKLLRAVTSAAQQARQQSQELASGRTGLMQMLQQALNVDVKDWRKRVSAAAAASADSGSPALSLEGPMDSHRDLQLCVKQAIADCGQLQVHEQALAQQLDTLGRHLQAAS